MTGKNTKSTTALKTPPKQEKYGILLAAYGATNTEAQVTLRLVEARVRASFPHIPVRWALTSELMRNRLAEQRTKTDSVAKALQKMYFERFTHVAVQSLNLIPGTEYDCLCANAFSMQESKRSAHDGAEASLASEKKMIGENTCEKAPLIETSCAEMSPFTCLSSSQQFGFCAMEVGAPLLNSSEDIEHVAKALAQHLPQERRPEDAVVFMGHGSWHGGGARYEALSQAVRRYDASILIGTMDVSNKGKEGTLPGGAHDIASILPCLRELHAKRVYLLPLLSLIGRHAVRDMAGEHAASWRSQIEAAGFSCVPVLRGIAENSSCLHLWIAHLAHALQKMRTN